VACPGRRQYRWRYLDDGRQSCVPDDKRRPLESISSGYGWRCTRRSANQPARRHQSADYVHGRWKAIHCRGRRSGTTRWRRAWRPWRSRRSWRAGRTWRSRRWTRCSGCTWSGSSTTRASCSGSTGDSAGPSTPLRVRAGRQGCESDPGTSARSGRRLRWVWRSASGRRPRWPRSTCSGCSTSCTSRTRRTRTVRVGGRELSSRCGGFVNG
jgi:hypothetical protein